MTDVVPALVCRRLRLRQFRNFAELELEFPTGGVAVIGDNGSGKTNLLESLYYLEIFRSFRGAVDEQLVRFGETVFHIRGWFEDTANGDAFEITAAWDARARIKRVTVNGTEPARLSEAIGQVRAVVFSPSDMAIVAGAPAERRRFLDIVLSVNRPGFLAVLQRYRHVLRQRNAALRAGRGFELVEAWNPAFIDAGASIVAERADWIARNAEGFARRYRSVGDGAQARLDYRVGLRLEGADARDRGAVIAAFTAETERLADRERDRGVTLMGPHRDDLLIATPADEGEVDLRDFGSGGQLRTAAIALRMVEAESIRESRGCAPLVLLDDVFAELDPGRSRRILQMLEAEGHGQVILTAPKESDVDLRNAAGSIGTLGRWNIAGGKIMVE
jgi:DNA replication and repair protein RecF